MKSFLRVARSGGARDRRNLGNELGGGSRPPTQTPNTPVGLGPIPAGVACAFPVSIDLVSGDKGKLFTFYDKDGNVVREAGTANHSTWLVTNLDTGKTYTVQLPGGLLTTTTSPDGTVNGVINGGVLGFNAPTDVPAGPFAFAGTGHFVFTIDPNDGHSTIVKETGQKTDLCAAVA